MMSAQEVKEFKISVPEGNYRPPGPKPRSQNNLVNIAMLMLLAFSMFFIFLFASFILDPMPNKELSVTPVKSKVKSSEVYQRKGNKIIKIKFLDKDPKLKKKGRFRQFMEMRTKTNETYFRSWRKPGKFMEESQDGKSGLRKLNPSDGKSVKTNENYYFLEEMKAKLRELNQKSSDKLIEKIEMLNVKLQKLKEEREEILMESLRQSDGESVEKFLERFENDIEKALKKRKDGANAHKSANAEKSANADKSETADKSENTDKSAKESDDDGNEEGEGGGEGEGDDDDDDDEEEGARTPSLDDNNINDDSDDEFDDDKDKSKRKKKQSKGDQAEEADPEIPRTIDIKEIYKNFKQRYEMAKYKPEKYLMLPKKVRRGSGKKKE